MNKINSKPTKEEVNSYLFGNRSKKLRKEIEKYIKRIKKETEVGESKPTKERFEHI